MFFRRVCFPALSALLAMGLPLAAQSVVSTHAGVVHYFEGLVAINGTPLQAQFGRFPEIPEGAELRTAQGRAEVLLGPGVMLRVAEDSAVKILSSSLADTRLELIAGSAILQSKDTLPGNSVTVFHKDWQMRVPHQGVYRIDSTPPQMRVYNGEVEVRTAEGAPVIAKAGQTLPFASLLVPDQTLGAPGDGFNEWAFDRSEAVAADNATAAQIVDDPALYPSLADASGLALAGYTYFPPTLGNPYMSYGTYGARTYGAWTPYGAGFGGAYGLGYGYGYGPLLGYPRRSVYSPLPAGVGLPSLPIRLPSIGGGYRPPASAFPTTRPGVAATPSIPHPAVTPMPTAHPVVHGGHR